MKVIATLMAALAVAGGTAAPGQPPGAEPAQVLAAERAWAGAEPLLQLATPVDADPAVRRAAIRALGRLEDPDLVRQLLALKGNVAIGARADAIAQALHGADLAAHLDVVQPALSWMFAVAAPPIATRETLAEVSAVMTPLSRMPYGSPEQVHQVEGILLRVANVAASDPLLQPDYLAAARAAESLARISARVTALDQPTVLRLRGMVRSSSPNDAPPVRLYALMALSASRAVDADTENTAMRDTDWQVRRVAVSVLAATGAGMADEARLDAIAAMLDDASPHVRYEALRAYARRGAAARGCAPIERLARDADPHVAVAALDALGDSCREDAAITDRIAALAKVPLASGSWHRSVHAFVALAKRSPEKAAPAMAAFAAHPVWWVRMYAAGAAAAAGDLVHLEKLAYDTNDNVREAALGPWRRLKKLDADPAIVDALGRSDVQLLRTAATLLKESPRNERALRALLDALARLTSEGKETSRDARLPLLDALAVHATAENATELLPLLKDFDPKVAEKAALVVTALTTKSVSAQPAPYRRGAAAELADLRQCVSVRLASGGAFTMQMEPSLAPVAVERFLQLATRDHYYDGLTIHRVVPNFVIQGGSPGANEYSGAKEFMRDEIAGANVRGSVGLSTRGRNTGDAQFFVNLVDNPRLDGDYTIFARLAGPADLAAVDRIQEGEIMRSIAPAPCAR